MQERRRDPWSGSTAAYTYDEFIGFYGPDEGHRAWNQARPRSKYYVGQLVVAITSLKGEEGQTVNKGDIGKVTAVPGPGVNIDPGAVAEVLINRVRFDAKPDMIEPAQEKQGGKPAAHQQKPPRLERRYDPNDRGHKKAYTHQEFIDEYGKKKGETMWAKAGEGRVEKRPDPKEPGSNTKYTKKEFFDFYGEKEGQALWKKAGGERKAKDDEKRSDPTEKGGKKYTKKEFVEHYGATKGKRLWDEAVEKRADPNESNGKKYSKKEFVKLYGEKKGNAMWKKAAESIKPDNVTKVTIERGDDGVIGWSREGLKIVDVEEGTPAEKAGVKRLYKITTVGGKKATDGNISSLIKDHKEGPLVVEFIELRTDTTDPNKSDFSHSEFLEFYGKEKGAVMWKKAGQRARQRKTKTKSDKDEDDGKEEEEEEEEKEEKEEEQ
eukprot:TRINITY_DN3721_c1_g1_i1.p2 TRINITY_DN3721_c1_g1~~TRINITY_DN3721_c1_g1_i1.p2  ORF type:complete len:448 (+),score=178.40 TRINITY_DN3721_c1_g1_i1:41-1345(+)